MGAWHEHWILPLGGRTVRRAAGQWPIGSTGLTELSQLLFSWQNVSEAGWISAERMFLDSACPLVWLRKSKKCQEDPPGCPSGHGAAWCIGITGHRNTFSFARDIYLAAWGLSFWPISLLWWNVKELGRFLNKVVITLCRLSPLSMTWSLKASVQNQASHLFLPSCPSPWWSLWNTAQAHPVDLQWLMTPWNISGHQSCQHQCLFTFGFSKKI